MPKKCPKCQSENPDSQKFCGECATPLPSIQDAVHTKTMETPVEELTTGSTFADRYQIIEELGKGGMGRVYKVLDKETKERIALKLIKPDIASDKKTIERFRNELTTARKIRHKNVCAMYDLNKEENSYYITMEYVSGGDLKKFIRRSGQLTVGKVISIAKQICEGLSEAHGLGIVHRDLKPNNIMIDDNGDARIMDFGIARTVKEKGITGSGVMIGTPEYMSPEQAEAKEIDHRSDIYSLGVILYEMTTGHLPFEGDTSLAVAMKHKGETPKDPKEFNAQIPDDLNGVILKCLEKGKEGRYQNALEIKSVLEKIEQGLPTTDRVIPERKTITSKEITVTLGVKKLLFPAIAVVVIIAVVLLLLLKKGPNLDPNLVAVAIFENQTGNTEYETLGRRISDWLSQGLGDIEPFEVVPVATVVAFSQEFQKGDYVQAIAKETGAGRVISGAYYLQGENLQIQSQVTDTQNKKSLYALDPVNGPADNIDETVQFLRQKIMGLMAMSIDDFSRGLLQLGIKPTYDAYEKMKLAVDTFNAGDQERASEISKQAMVLDPDFKFPLWSIAAYYMNYSRWAELEELINRTLKSQEDLDPATKILVIDYSRAELLGDREGCYKAIKQGARLLNTSIFDYLVALEANWLNRPSEAIDWLNRIDLESNSYVQEWGGYWGEMTWALHKLGRYEEELKVARKYLEYNPERRAPLNYEIRALVGLGKIDDVSLVIERSLTFPPQGTSHGDLLYRTARALRIHGFRDMSSQVLERALDWYMDRTQEEKSTRDYRRRVANILYMLERWEEAQDICDKLYAEWPDSVTHLGYLGTLAAKRGQVEEAKRLSEELRIVEFPYLHGLNTYWRSAIATILGEKDEAIGLIREAISEGQNYNILFWNVNYESLEDYPPFVELKEPKG